MLVSLHPGFWLSGIVVFMERNKCNVWLRRNTVWNYRQTIEDWRPQVSNDEGPKWPVLQSACLHGKLLQKVDEVNDFVD